MFSQDVMRVWVALGVLGHLGGSHTEKSPWTRYNGPKPSLGNVIRENTRLVLMRFSLAYPYKKTYAKMAKKVKNDQFEEKKQKSLKIGR